MERNLKLRDLPEHDERRGGRPAAGTDPQKRRQILEGAGRIFSTLGFDAASMSDVAREAAGFEGDALRLLPGQGASLHRHLRREARPQYLGADRVARLRQSRSRRC